jgi:hypothetical protein
MSPHEPLSRAAGDLLQQALELTDCVMLRAYVDDVEPGLADQLLRIAAFKPSGYVRWIREQNDLSVDIHELDSLTGGLSYFAGTDGYRKASHDELSLVQLDLDWWVNWLATNLSLVGKPVEIVPRLAWDLGDLWITSKRRAPILFARRLRIEDVAGAVRNALRARMGRSGGYLLTSGNASDAEMIDWPGGHYVTRLSAVMSSSTANFELDIDLVKSPFVGSESPALSAVPIHLSPDGMVLTVHGDDLFFRGEKQIEIIKKLMQTLNGKPQRTRDVLSGSSADSLAKAFRGSPSWPKLKSIIRQRNGACWLEP